jgi:hypothetical protein
MARTNLTACICALVVVAASGQAACGGGGYRPAKKNDVAPSPAIQTAASATVNARDVRKNSNAILIRRLNMAEFNQIRPQLNLSEKQADEIKNLEADIKRKGDEAIAQVKSYDGRQDFDQRVPEILTPEQLKILQGSKVAHR